MTTASTTLLGLALPVTGELSGTWGDVVNASLTNLLDTAIAGTTTLSSDADVTLTTTTLSSNQARQAVILWTAGGTATRTITAPAQSKSYVVINATSSSQSIKLVGVGPTTGITIVAGEKCFAAWNGSDFVKVGNTSGAGVFSTVTASSLTSGRVTYAGTAGLLQDSANLTFNGTTLTANTIGAFTLGGTVAGGGNQLNNVVIGTTTPLAGNFTTLSASSTATLSGLTASTALALDASKNIVSVTNTGSGNNVLATSPTITGATLTTSAFNGTVGATTPSTGAFTTVTASGLLDGANFTIGNGGGAYFGLVNDALGRGSANYAIQQGSAGNTIVGAPSGQTVTQAVNDVAITVASSTGLAVTGALSASGTNGQLDVSAASTGFARLKLANTGGSYYFGANDSTGTAFGGTAYAMSIAAPTGKVIESLINASVVTSVSSTGLAVTGTAIASTSIGVGNTTPSGGGAGIAFPATQSASTDANTLDDYEEGTWTPSIGGTATYTAQQGTYRKVGSVVFYTAYVQINSLGTGTTAYLSGLPFSTATTSNWAGSAAATTAATNIVSIYCLVGSTQINLYSRTAASASPAINTIWQNGALVEVNGFYFV